VLYLGNFERERGGFLRYTEDLHGFIHWFFHRKKVKKAKITLFFESYPQKWKFFKEFKTR